MHSICFCRFQGCSCRAYANKFVELETSPAAVIGGIIHVPRADHDPTFFRLRNAEDESEWRCIFLEALGVIQVKAIIRKLGLQSFAATILSSDPEQHTPHSSYSEFILIREFQLKFRRIETIGRTERK